MLESCFFFLKSLAQIFNQPVQHIQKLVFFRSREPGKDQFIVPGQYLKQPGLQSPGFGSCLDLFFAAVF
jgi:hypothetical protein